MKRLFGFLAAFMFLINGFSLGLAVYAEDEQEPSQEIESLTVHVETTYSEIEVSMLSDIAYITQVLTLGPPELTITHGQLHGGSLTEMVHSVTGTVRINNTQVYYPTSSVMFSIENVI